MKLPLTFAVPVLVSVAAVLQSGTADARPRHHHHHYHHGYARHAAAQPLFGAPFAVRPAANGSSFMGLGGDTSGAISGRAYSRRVARAERRSNRVRYATNEVQAGAVMSDANRIAPATAFAGGGSSDLVSEARRYLGGNPTGKASLWCGNFMNLVLKRTGHAVSNSNQARSFASYGQRVSGPQVGAIAVMSRRGGGHVGVVSGVDANGNVIVVSGNHNRRVAESVYPRSRIYAYVMPR